ncbi:MAG: hypothetical protein ABFS34_04020 [Gemmatimonadota bacterium]
MWSSRGVGSLALLASVACGGAPPSDPLPDVGEESAAVGPHFRVACHFDCGAGAAEALGVAELAWARAAELLSLPDSAYRRPPVLRLYRREAFRAVSARLGDGRLEEAGAISSPQRRAAFIELLPPVSPAALGRSGLPAETLRLITHEATHLTMSAAAEGPPRAPDWLSEGVAQAVERWVGRELDLYPGDEGPRLAIQTWRAYSLLRNGLLPRASELLVEGRDEVRTPFDYAVRALFFAYLAEREPDLLGSLTAYAAARLGADDLPDSLAALVRAGSDRFGELDGGFADYVMDAAATGRRLELRGFAGGRRFPHAGLPRGAVRVLATRPAAAGRYAIVGSLSAARGSDRQAAVGVIVGNSGGRRVLVEFARDSVAVRLEEARAGVVTASRSVASAAAPRTDGTLRFRIEVAETEVSGLSSITVRFSSVGVGSDAGGAWLDGPLVARVAGFDPRGHWGVYAAPGWAGVWTDLRLETED